MSVKQIDNLNRHWWQLELEVAPGKWIPTSYSRFTVRKPKKQVFDAMGRATRWVDRGLVVDW
jgi:hypothetical protein